MEDPIEYVFENRKSLIQQREFNEDFYDFSQAVKMALRQDPDILMIGEIRDTATMKAALEAAETGHLVLGTLHAGSAIEAIMRMESFFMQNEQNSNMYANCSEFKLHYCTAIIRAINGELVCCMEILLALSAVNKYNSPRTKSAIDFANAN